MICDTVTVKRAANFDYKSWVKRSATQADFQTLITNNTFFKDENGKPILYYGTLPRPLTQVKKAVCKIQYSSNTRTGGLKTTSRVFGYQPRITIRRDFCATASLVTEDPEANAELCAAGEHVAQIYGKFFPDVYASHKLQTNRVLAEWQIPNTVFTSGIVNKNNPLKYHFDAGNFPNVCSCMLGFKRDSGGGFLALPEYNMALEIADNSLTIFDGQSVLHGVTPIVKLTPQSYRYTVVYYSLKGMWNCEPLNQEIARIRNIRTGRETKRANIKDEFVLDQNGNLHGTDESIAGGTK